MVRALILGFAWAVLIVMAVGLNIVSTWGAEQLGASPRTIDIINAIEQTYVVVVIIASAVSSLRDIWSLMLSGVQSENAVDEGNQDVSVSISPEDDPAA
ncbi:MAG: hypothetical protein CL694_07620 [Chloroflexi bacterium]|nr:hypothetical protein [Chloroflexota bacterium]HAL47797.1 hypothetical protein [Dehalococcoidia bacterium]